MMVPDCSLPMIILMIIIIIIIVILRQCLWCCYDGQSHFESTQFI